jgi:hypothetical protein
MVSKIFPKGKAINAAKCNGARPSGPQRIQIVRRSPLIRTIHFQATRCGPACRTPPSAHIQDTSFGIPCAYCSRMKKILLAIGIVTIAVGVLYAARAWSTLRVNAKTAQFNDDIENLFSGLQKYKERVGSYPVGSNAQVAKALQGQNAKSVIIVVGRKTELNEKGEFVDPWGTPLRIYFCDTGVLIRSAGPNRRFDDSTVLEADDYYKSN